MKKILILLSCFTFIIASCERDDSERFLDVENQDNAIAQFNNGGPVLVFNPVEDTANILEVGVSTVSDTDRMFTISITDSTSTIDPSLFNIPSLSGIIPAGSFTGELIINTPQTEVFPAQGAVLAVVLESVTGARLLESSDLEVELDFTVECPSVELDLVVGSAVTTSNPLLEAFGVPATFSDPRTVIAGPNDNQITIIGGLSPAIGSSDIILTVDLETGRATGRAVPEQTSEALPLGNSFNNGGVPTRTTSITGQVLSCINQLSFTINNNTFAVPFNSNTVVLQF